MAIQTRQEVEFELGGRTYVVRPTFKKINDIETRFGAGLPLLNKLLAGQLTAAEIVSISSQYRSVSTPVA